jgi:hypothetical protein
LKIHTDGRVYFNSESSRISALRYDLDTRYGGGIYYQNLDSQSPDFNSIKSDLNRLNSNFVPTNLFRIKYDNVPNWSDGSLGTLRASFQIVLARDVTKSYVLLKYTSCLSGSTLIETPGLYYLSSSTGQQMSNTISSPCSNSNVNQAGTWVFDVSPLESKKILTNDFILFFYNYSDSGRAIRPFLHTFYSTRLRLN